jgi:hypothetical protein
LENKTLIYQKLEAFIKKFYLNELLRGLIFFVGLGLLYLLFTVFIEYFLWLPPLGRTFLFIAFVLVQVYLLFRFVLFPLFKLFKLKQGLNYKEASILIGKHFSEIDDKLLNFLQLSNDSNPSELLLASIDQKASLLQPIPFANAINFQTNKKYLPLAAFPILLFLFFYFSGNGTVISQSINRVVHFKDQFSPPAPFQFVVLNTNLQTHQNQDFILQVKTVGNVVPQKAVFVIGEERYFMENSGPGLFQFKIEKPTQNISFHLEANELLSPDFTLSVFQVPAIANFEMILNFPKYLNKPSEKVKGNGNVLLPEGTAVTWRIQAIATQSIVWSDSQVTNPFSKSNNQFLFSKNINQDTEYQISTSNSEVNNYEKLGYRISVIKDQFPSITVSAAPDSIELQKNYLLGKISDDYGLSKLQVVYYEANRPATAKRGTLPVKSLAFDQFVFSFPSNLPVVDGITYEYYFEVFDNDAMHHFKSTKSSVFSSRILTEADKQQQLLQQQNDNINSLSRSLQNQDKQFDQLDKIQKSGNEKSSFDFKEQQKVNDFIKRQEQQDHLMKEFSKKLAENLSQSKSVKKDETKELLEKRLDKVQSDIEKNQKLLDELKQLNDKLKNESLLEKLDQFKQTSKNQTKSLEQLVELTKKYYVEQKAKQVADKLNDLGLKLDKLADNEKENSFKKQEDINQDFDKIKSELDALKKENNELKNPLDLPENFPQEQSIDQDLKKASDDLQNQKKDKAKPKQKSASKKMMEMGLKIQSGAADAAQDQLEEDVKMLRQVLDNLLAFSFSQENVLRQFKVLKRGAPAFSKYLKVQQDLKQQFKHVDDSLFAMSLRNPKIAESVTKEIGNVHYNIDKSLQFLVDAQLPKGLSHQQYTITAANTLANSLSDVLNSMQLEMSGSGSGSGGKPKPGKGQGDGMQLPDIIKKQEGLAQKMKDAMKKGNSPGSGAKPGSGNPGKSGSQGSAPGGSQNGGNSGSDGEGDAKALLEIYKEQNQLREALQKELAKQGQNGNGQNAAQQMKQLEKQLLNKGFSNEALQKMLNIKYELLKFNTAIQQQGQEEQRQGRTNTKSFNSNAQPLPANLQEYLNSIEILNRQSLPLQPNFNRKVKQYFKNND